MKRMTWTPDEFSMVKVKGGEVSKGNAVAYLGIVRKSNIMMMERRSLASKGWALPDGSYPIRNKKDLKSAIILAQSGHGNVAAAKKLIIRRADDLGANDMVPSDWDISKRQTTFMGEAERQELAKRFWDEALHPRLPGGHHGGGEFMSSHSLVPGESRRHKDDISPFPEIKSVTRRARGTGARAASSATRATTPRVRAVKETKAVTSRAPKVKIDETPKVPAPRAPRVGTPAPASGLYDPKLKSVSDKKSIPRINRGGTHIMYKEDGKTPLVRAPYDEPGKAYYARNADPKTKITNERLKQIFEDPSTMTAAEKKMISSAGGAKALDGSDEIKVDTSRGPRILERYQAFGQIRSKIAPGSGDRTAVRQDEEKRAKQAAKRRASGKVSSTEFGKIQKKITEDWSTDGGKTVPCVFCMKPLPPEAMSIETPKPKELGGNYKDRGGVWPAHNVCNTAAGTHAQANSLAYMEQMLKQFNKLPLNTRKRLPFVYDYFPQLGGYPGTSIERDKHMKGGKR